MKKAWFWTLGVLAGILLTAGIGWMLRFEWLPWVLVALLQPYDIDRLRYERMEWDHPTELTFHHLAIEKGGWIFQAETLFVRLGPRSALHAGRSQIIPCETYAGSRPSTPKPTWPSPRPLFAMLSLLHRIDTLFVEELTLPYDLKLSLQKRGGQAAPFALKHPRACLQGTLWIERKSLHFEVKGGRLEGPASFRWDSLAGSLQALQDTVRIELRGWGLAFYHRRLASRPLRYDSAGWTLHLVQASETLYAHLRPQLLPWQGHFWLAATRDPFTFTVLLEAPPQPHEAYLAAFPQGFFSCLNRARFAGTSALLMRLRYDPALTDTLDLSVEWQSKNFGILSWTGTSPLTLRESFLYRPYLSSREIWVGPENPAFLSFRQITPYVLLAVLHSEDGLFFHHQGFQKEPLLKALLENWRCRCFRRGAGTLTMQVVRNLLLTREKTLARKVEEVLLTALIERFRLLSKERLAELYFNIVEWGPEVYGLTEAAHFYFAKEPHELTIPEALFLGVILPSPRAYRYFVDKETQCALPSLDGHFRRVTGFLVLQNYLPADSIETIRPERTCLLGPAQRLLQVSVSHDTLP